MRRLNTISRQLLSFFIFFLIIGASVTGSILKKSKLKLRIVSYEIGSFELKLMKGYDEDLPVDSLVFETFPQMQVYIPGVLPSIGDAVFLLTFYHRMSGRMG